MVFGSIEFIFIFLPIFLVFYSVASKGFFRNLVLLVGSVFFIAWTDIRFLPSLFFLITVNYFILLLLCKSKSLKSRFSIVFQATGILLNLGLLIGIKYFGLNLDLSTFTLKTSSVALNIPGSIGISYIAFSLISYFVDVGNDRVKPDLNPLVFTNYIVMFPKYLIGPITRYSQIQDEFNKPVPHGAQVAQGVRRFILGFAKKAIIADTLAVASNSVFNTDLYKLDMGAAWFG